MSDEMWVRTRGGAVFHRASCRHAKAASATPWNWAEGKTLPEIVRSLGLSGLLHDVKPCRQCIGAAVIDVLPMPPSGETAE